MTNEKFSMESVRELLGSAYKPNQKLRDLKIIKNKLLDYRSRIHPPHNQINEVENAINHVKSEIASKHRIYTAIVFAIIIPIFAGVLLLALEHNTSLFK